MVIAGEKMSAIQRSTPIQRITMIVKSLTIKQDYLRMNVAPDQTIILGLQTFLDHRSLSSIDQKILMKSEK